MGGAALMARVACERSASCACAAVRRIAAAAGIVDAVTSRVPTCQTTTMVRMTGPTGTRRSCIEASSVRASLWTQEGVAIGVMLHVAIRPSPQERFTGESANSAVLCEAMFTAR